MPIGGKRHVYGFNDLVNGWTGRGGRRRAEGQGGRARSRKRGFRSHVDER